MAVTICFDVIGTMFGYGPIIEVLEETLTSSRKFPNNVQFNPTVLFMAWFWAAQRDFTYLSQAGQYTPIAQVLKSTLPRALEVAGIPKDALGDNDSYTIVKQFQELEPRPGLVEAIRTLKNEMKGVELWAVTNGAKSTTQNYFKKAALEGSQGLGDLDTRVISCDEIKLAKADPKVYENALSKMKKELGESTIQASWFVASHTWDLVAARAAGFKTAYLTFEEKDGAFDIFGKPGEY